MTSAIAFGGRRARLVIAAVATLLLALGVMVLQASPAFAADPTLTVSRSGAGTVTSDPAGIDCGSDCTEDYPNTFERVCETIDGQTVCSNQPVYQDVTLTASTPSGWSFGGWGGACSGTATTCTLTMDADKSVSATFDDIQNPSVALTSPTGPYVTGTIAIQASASDNDRVSKVEFYVGSTKVGEDTTAPYSVSFNTVGGRGDGSYEFRAVATDPSGRSSAASRTVIVDNTPPTINITSGPIGQTFGPGTTQTWTFSAGDLGSGLNSVQCSVVATGSAASFGPCSGGTTSHSVTNKPGGNYTFTVRAVDNVGLQTTQSRIFSIDATAPNTQIDSGIADGGVTNQTSLTFNFSASESGSTFECRVYPAALTPVAFEACSGTGSHTASGFSPGTYTFEVRATDPYGNRDGSPAKRTFTIDTTAPTVETWSPKGKKVKPTAKPTVTFSEKMDENSVEASANGKPTTFILKKGTTVIPATVAYTESGTTFKAVMTPTKPLKRGAKYTATVTTAATDVVGNALLAKSWTFTVKR